GPPASAAGKVSVSVSCNTCGNGTVEGGEQCDDGNYVDGDCCSKSCTYEADASPCDNGDTCTGDLCNATGTCVGGTGTDLCDDNSPCTTDSCGAVCTHTAEVNLTCGTGSKGLLLLKKNA